MKMSPGLRLSGTPRASCGLLPADEQPKETTMGDLLKGGILWLLGIPLVLVIVLFAIGIL